VYALLIGKRRDTIQSLSDCEYLKKILEEENTRLRAYITKIECSDDRMYEIMQIQMYCKDSDEYAKLEEERNSLELSKASVAIYVNEYNTQINCINMMKYIIQQSNEELALVESTINKCIEEIKRK
jgi:hypothetical protein